MLGSIKTTVLMSTTTMIFSGFVFLVWALWQNETLSYILLNNRQKCAQRNLMISSVCILLCFSSIFFFFSSFPFSLALNESRFVYVLFYSDDAILDGLLFVIWNINFCLSFFVSHSVCGVCCPGADSHWSMSHRIFSGCKRLMVVMVDSGGSCQLLFFLVCNACIRADDDVYL